MTFDNSEQSGGRFRALLQRALRRDHEAAWQLLEEYGDQLLHMLLIKRREQPDSPGDASQLVALLWDFLRPGHFKTNSVSTSAVDDSSLDIESVTESQDHLTSADVATVGLSSPEAPTLNTTSVFGDYPSLEAQLESARRRWKHLIVTPSIHSRILQQRLQGASIAEIANELGLSEPVVKHVLANQVRHEGPPR